MLTALLLDEVYFVQLEIKTRGWQVIAPAQTGNLLFHLHRYDAQGQGDAPDSRRRIDAIL